MMLKKGNTFTRTHKKHTVGKRDGHVSFGQSKHDHTLKFKKKNSIVISRAQDHDTSQRASFFSGFVEEGKIKWIVVADLCIPNNVFVFLFLFIAFYFYVFRVFSFLFLFLYLFFLFTVLQKKENWLSLKRNRKNKNWTKIIGEQKK